MDKNTQKPTNSDDKASRQAAEQVILRQLDQIYGVNTDGADVSNSAVSSAETTSEVDQPTTSTNTQLANQNLYNQTYQQAEAPTPDWQAYHSAWQNYYQKYYEYYYTEQLKRQTTTVKAQLHQATISTSQTNPPANAKINPKDQALKELRDKLRAKMTDQAQKARKSRHFWPATTALAVMLIFLFLQYNRLLVGQVRAYITPADTSPSTVVVDPTVNVGVGPEPRLIIPKINVNVPVAYDIGNDNASQQEAMKHGVAQSVTHRFLATLRMMFLKKVITNLFSPNLTVSNQAI